MPIFAARLLHPLFARGLAVLLVLSVVCWPAWAATSVVVHFRTTLTVREPVYTVAEVYAHLGQAPVSWGDRTVLVRAVAGACSTWLGPAYTSPCLDWQPALVDSSERTPDLTLPLARGTTPALLAFLRHLPFVQRLVPPPQPLVWGTMAVYRIQLRQAACAPLHGAPCYEAVLLDAAPGSP